MTKLAHSNTTAPEVFQTMFRQIAKPWRFDDEWLDSMISSVPTFSHQSFVS
jgi:hypothetical protein